MDISRKVDIKWKWIVCEKIFEFFESGYFAQKGIFLKKINLQKADIFRKMSFEKVVIYLLFQVVWSKWIFVGRIRWVIFVWFWSIENFFWLATIWSWKWFCSSRECCLNNLLKKYKMSIAILFETFWDILDKWII